jgi:DNA-binding response OmpR family regulator
MAGTLQHDSNWQVPTSVVRAKVTAENWVATTWLTNARSALEASTLSGRLHVAEVDRAPDVTLIAGSADWAADVVSQSRRAGDPTPVVVLNLSSEDGATARILDAGADECLACPFDSDELRARLQALLRRLAPTLQSSSDVAVDRASLRIRVRNVEARLSRKQFDLFACLAAHRERWVHSDEIIATVCGTHHSPTTSLVRVQVHAIRKALGVAHECIRCDGHRSYMLTLLAGT